MSFLIISLIIQVAFIVHVIKTGRNTLWIWVLISLLAMPGHHRVHRRRDAFRS